LSLLHRLLSIPFIARLPVRVRGGFAEGARWSLYPFSSYWRGTHEPALQARVLTLLDWPGKSVWDLGAHYGLFAIGLARHVGPSGHVAAFEPNPLSFARLRLHADRNPHPNLRVFPAAVSDQPGHQTLILASYAETTISHLPYDHETHDSSTPSVTVPLVRLDDLVASGAIQAPHFIKLDVEGHGHRALAGAARTLAEHLPVIISGIHSPSESAGLLELLLPLGYTVEPLDAGIAAIPHHEGDYLWLPPSPSASNSPLLAPSS
jgi:FkbM family methyltransferase